MQISGEVNDIILKGYELAKGNKDEFVTAEHLLYGITFVERFINICGNEKITIWNLKRNKNVKLELNIGIKDLKKVAKIAKQTNCKMKIIKKLKKF